MSQSFDPIAAPDALEAAIDRLVADDLDADARRALLHLLDAHPDGWRRCALAFLEDQAWRSALAGPRGVASFDPAALPMTRTKRNVARSIARCAAAACLLAAFAAGGFRFGVVSADRPAAPGLTQLDPVLAPPRPIEPRGVIPEPGHAIGYLSLVDPADGEAPPRQVPVLEATASNERWLAEQPATIPDYVKAQWERRGYQVEEHRRLVGLDLADGRRVAIPVDEVDLDYVGREPL